MTCHTWVARLSRVPGPAVSPPVAGLAHAHWPPEVRHTRGAVITRRAGATRGPGVVTHLLFFLCIFFQFFFFWSPRASPVRASGGWPWSRRWGWASGRRRPARWWSRTRDWRCTGAWNRGTGHYSWWYLAIMIVLIIDAIIHLIPVVCEVQNRYGETGKIAI